MEGALSLAAIAPHYILVRRSLQQGIVELLPSLLLARPGGPRT
jgi:hypothetical protein